MKGHTVGRLPAASAARRAVIKRLGTLAVGLVAGVAWPTETLALARADVKLSLVELTNGERTRHGLGRVEMDPALDEVAHARASSQLGSGPLSHYDAEGRLAFKGLMDNIGMEYLLAGENLARTPRTDQATPEAVIQALMLSPTHRRNILEPSFNRLAIGLATDPNGRVAIAQIFRAVGV